MSASRVRALRWIPVVASAFALDAHAPASGPVMLQACEVPAAAEPEFFVEPVFFVDAPLEEEQIEKEQVAETTPMGATEQALVEYVSKRFRVALAPTATMVRAAHRAAEELALDPLLVLAVIAVESRFNPIAESSAGAKGLMQIIPKYHLDKLAEHGEEGVLDPHVNIRAGARILDEYIERTGTLQDGLQFYNGASWDASAKYSQKVMLERERFERAVSDAQL